MSCKRSAEQQQLEAQLESVALQRTELKLRIKEIRHLKYTVRMFYLAIASFLVSAVANYVSEANRNESEQKHWREHANVELYHQNDLLLAHFLEYPELRRFFYPTNDQVGALAIPYPADPRYFPELGNSGRSMEVLDQRVLTVCELWMDLFDHVSLKYEDLEPGMKKSWRDYAQFVHRSSPALQYFWRGNCFYYSRRVPELLGIECLTRRDAEGQSNSCRCAD